MKRHGNTADPIIINEGQQSGASVAAEGQKQWISDMQSGMNT